MDQLFWMYVLLVVMSIILGTSIAVLFWAIRLANVMVGQLVQLLIVVNRMEAHGEQVATDLADAHRRADAVPLSEHGAAADAAARTGEDDK